MFGVIIFIGICVLLFMGYKRLTRDMFDDYKYMMSQAEPRDFNQDITDKMCTSMCGNDFVQNMVDVSMLNQSDGEK